MNFKCLKDLKCLAWLYGQRTGKGTSSVSQTTMSNSQTAQTSHKNTRGTHKIPPDSTPPSPPPPYTPLASLCYKECYSVPSDFSYTAEAILMNNSLHGNKRQIIKLEDEGGGMWEREKVTAIERGKERNVAVSMASHTSGGHVWHWVLMMVFLSSPQLAVAQRERLSTAQRRRGVAGLPPLSVSGLQRADTSISTISGSKLTNNP